MDTSRSPSESSGFSKKMAAAIIIVYTVLTLIPITWIIPGFDKLIIVKNCQNIRFRA
mgnify:CR=1 FL=1